MYVGKLLEKALRDAIKEEKCVVGARNVLGSIKDSKMIVLSQSVPGRLQEIGAGAKEAGIPAVAFRGSSVALGRLCGLQFRVSAISLTSVADANVQSILNENGEE